MDVEQFFFGLWQAMYYQQLCKCFTKLSAIRIHFHITAGLSQRPGHPTFFLGRSEVLVKVSVSRAALNNRCLIDPIGNVQLATYARTSIDALFILIWSFRAILSDVTPPERRTRSLALIGIAFSICFCIGPPIGAYFASRPLPQTLVLSGIELNIYATPAFITLILLLVETLFLAIALPETRGIRPPDETVAKKDGKTNNGRPKGTVKQRLATLKSAKLAHFGFLSVFSGMAPPMCLIPFLICITRD